MDKKHWTRPELQVIVRQHREEAVLTVCKGTSLGSSNADDSSCTNLGLPCLTCSGLGAS